MSRWFVVLTTFVTKHPTNYNAVFFLSAKILWATGTHLETEERRMKSEMSYNIPKSVQLEQAQQQQIILLEIK